MATGDLTTLAALYLLVPELSDHSDDTWLSGIISSVSGALEEASGRRWLAPRAAATILLDRRDIDPSGWELRVRRGVTSVTYLGVADYDQPDDGTGSYTEILPAWLAVRPRPQDRPDPTSAGTEVRVLYGAPRRLPLWDGLNTVKLTGALGPSAVRGRDGQIAATAVVRAWRAKTSGGADYSIIGPDGGMKILRDLAPAELAEIAATYRVPVAR